MGWASGVDERGRPIGYAVDATCDTDGGCGTYHCARHLFLTGGLCGSCAR